jgi:hypothetical protein
MKMMHNTKAVELPGNKLGKKGGELILSSLTEKVRIIDLSNNDIGTDGLQNLVKWIDGT